MSMQVSIYPNPFISSLSFEVIVENNVSAIVQMLDQDLKIIRMLSWLLKEGSNKTTIEDLEFLPAGTYYIDIKNHEGNNLFTTKLAKLVETYEL
ncbi:MAG: hypothetical protein ABIQ00_20025 [Chitinophagaceae bacterium]